MPGLIALPDSTVIKGDDLEPPGKSGDLILPKGRKPGEPGDEQDGETHATPLVVERAVTDRNQRHRYAVQKVPRSVSLARVACQRKRHARHAGVNSVDRPWRFDPASVLTHGNRSIG